MFSRWCCHWYAGGAAAVASSNKSGSRKDSGCGGRGGGDGTGDGNSNGDGDGDGNTPPPPDAARMAAAAVGNQKYMALPVFIPAPILGVTAFECIFDNPLILIKVIKSAGTNFNEACCMLECTLKTSATSFIYLNIT